MLLKYHNFISLAFSLVFWFLVQQFSVNPIFRVFAFLLIIFLLTLFFYNKYYLRKINKYNIYTVLGPVLFYFSSVCLYFFIPTNFTKIIFLFLVCILGIVSQVFLGNFVESIMLGQSLVTAFFIFSSLVAANFNFPGFYFMYLIGVFLSAIFISRSFFEFSPYTQKEKLITALVIGLLCAQFYWVENFLPPHYSALGLFLFNFFYFILMLSYYHMFNTLNFKKIQFHLILVTVTSLVVAVVTPWTINN